MESIDAQLHIQSHYAEKGDERDESCCWKIKVTQLNNTTMNIQRDQ